MTCPVTTCATAGSSHLYVRLRCRALPSTGRTAVTGVEMRDGCVAGLGRALVVQSVAPHNFTRRCTGRPPVPRGLLCPHPFPFMLPYFGGVLTMQSVLV